MTTRPWAGLIEAGRAFKASAPTLQAEPLPQAGRALASHAEPRLSLPPVTLPELRASLPTHAAALPESESHLPESDADGVSLPDGIPTKLPTSKPKKKPETLLEGRIIRALEKIGCRVVKRKVALTERGGRRFMHGTPGEADLEVFHAPGRCLFLEVKTPEGTVQPNQERWLAARRAEGFIAEVVRSVDEAVDVVTKARG